MTRVVRQLFFSILGLAVFSAPTGIAYALWSTTATATAGVTVVAAAPPAAPVVACGGRANNNEYTLTWQQAAGATEYTVHRSASALENYTPIATLEGLSYTASMTTDGTLFFRVRAGNSAGASAFSRTVSVVRAGNGTNNFTCTVLP